MLASEILQQLNEDREHRFPILDVSYPIDVRLSAFRTEEDWALVVEAFVFNEQRLYHQGAITEIWCYGSSLPQAPGKYYPELHVTGDGPHGPLFNVDDYDNSISSSAHDMTIRGNVVPITTEPSEYAAAGIELCQPPRIFAHELLRLISPHHRRLIFATEREITERIGQSMPLLMRLDEWRHPDITQLPAESTSFQMIATAIARNDPALYEPTVPPNTHWSNWPMAGMV